jgi:signal transduction histidine kinase
MVSAAKLRRSVVVLSLLVSVAVCAGFLVWAGQERSRAIEGARSRALHSSQLAAQRVDAGLSGIAKVLAGLESAYRLLGDDNPEMLAVMRRQMPLIGEARALLVIAADGQTRYVSNQPAPLTRRDLSDRDYFRVHLESAGRTFLSSPLKSRGDGTWILVVSRSMTGARGEFLGVVAASVSIDALSTDLKSALSDAESSAMIIDSQGIVMARFPASTGEIGQSLTEFPVFHRMPDEWSGTGEALSPLDGRDRLYGFTRSLDFPHLTVVSLDSRRVLGQWQERMILPGVLLLGLLLLTGALVSRLLGQLQKMERAQAQVQSAQQAAAAAAEAKAAFIGCASHELRTPLTTIVGFADTLVQGMPGQECQSRCHEYLGHVASAGRHLQAVVNDLLDLARIEIGGLVIERVPVDLATVVRETLRSARDLAARRDVELIGLGLDEVVRVEGDNLRLRQMLLNLVSEALRVSPKGERVEVRLSVVGADEARITVTDQGPGMTGSELQSAMAPLSRPPAHRSRPGEGTGLGLPLADQLAKLHGGRVEIVSRKGEGTVVTVVLPRNQLVTG